jgi:PIN domain
VIYLDTSVVLSRLFNEAQSPPDAFWSNSFTSSRLLEYEVLNRVHARAPGSVLIDDARTLLDQCSLLDLSPSTLVRALSPFPVPVRTLDGLHLATMDFLRLHGQSVELASYDQRLNGAALALGFQLVVL